MSASPNPPHSSASASGPNAAGDTQILCKWKDCGLMFDDAETIYKHLCEDHVGRKSTGNLCLQCKWEGCDASSAAKRHHITSHLIVHTPFKPHSCSFCNKTFKRPQDLKKHERIHDNSTSRAKAANASSSAPKDLYPHPAYNQMQLEAAQRANAMYASHHGHHPGANLQPHGGYPQVSYPQVKRELTPNYGEASSSASLSPLSSHLGTPANGNSPSVYPNQYNNGGSYGQYPQPSHYNSHQQFHHQQPQQQQLYQMNAGSYMGLVPPSSMTKQEITPQHQPHPNDAYSYLGQGTHHAGSKRGYEEMLVGDFADDVRKKRITTNYNEEMASRLNSISQYSSGFDDGTINGLFSNDVPGWNSNGDDASRGAGGNTDLAQLNSFLLQLGANIAGNDVKPEETSTSSSASSSSQSQPALSPNSHSSASSHAASPPDSSSSSSEHHFNNTNNKSEIHFDLSGLNGIQGFDESLLQGVNWSSSDNHDDFFNHQTFAPRPIAHLPSRSHGQQPMGFGGQGQNYTHTSYPQTGFGQGQTTSFDSLRTSRGPALVPQLAQLDSVNHNYRKVEALQRAAPIVGSGGPTSLPSYSGKNASNDEEMEEVDNKEHSSSSYRQRSSSPAVSEASSRTSSSATSSPAPITHGLYPKMTSVSVGDPSRRLPTPLTSSSSGGPSISSILASSTTTDAASFTQHQRAGSYTTRNTSNLRTGFRDQSEDNASDDTGNSTPLGSTRSRSASYGLESPRVNNNATPSKIYPSLPSDDNMEVDEVHNEMSNLGLANKNSKVVMDVETRKRHLDLIRRLLIAINYPQQQRRETIEENGSDSGSESDSSIERDLPPMKNGSDSIQQDSSPLPGIDQLLKAGGHRRKSISSSKSQLQQHHHHQQRQQTSERLPGVDV